MDLPFNTDPFFYFASVPAVLLLGIVAYRKDLDKCLLRFMLLFALCGILIGTMFFKYLDAQLCKLFGALALGSLFITNGLSACCVGFKGEREIASGLKANVVMEFEVDPCTETQAIKIRTGIVGLSVGWATRHLVVAMP
ncbi:hypothetical protein [Limnohabitans sp.]|uniref:hypothetical protein n=1 Tax=Limnohabitans sp. TaxID=1907725 RepID=UPI00261D681E|nr:hypothetical protein [Limnohabitans sp.]